MSGLALSLLSIFFFSLMGAMVKAVSVTIPSMEIVFIRSVFTLVVVVGYMFKRGYSFKVENLFLLSLRGLFGGLGLMGFFYMLSQIKLGEAGIIFQMIPVFVVLFSWIVLKERLGYLGFILLIIPIIGAIMVIKPSLQSITFFPAMIGLVSSMFAAGAYILVRVLSVKHNTYLIVLAFAVGAIITSAPFALSKFVSPAPSAWLLLMGLSSCSVLAQVALTKAYSREKASIVSMMGYSGIIFNVLMGYLFWNEMIDLWSWVGGFLIIGACVGLNFRKRLSV